MQQRGVSSGSGETVAEGMDEGSCAPAPAPKRTTAVKVSRRDKFAAANAAKNSGAPIMSIITADLDDSAEPPRRLEYQPSQIEINTNQDDLKIIK